MTLPKGTSLGKLSMFEVYVDHDGPRLFAAVNESAAYFLGVATDEDDDSSQWLYAPVSRRTLELVRAGEVNLAEPFRHPPDGYLVQVITPRRGADTATSVPRQEVADADLPQLGFPLALTTVPERWRLEALRDAAAVGERAHEARLIPKQKPATVLLPATVASLLRRWDQFWHAIVPNEALRVATVVPGSLRIVFAAAKAKQGPLLVAYEELVDCGTDAPRLRLATRRAAVASAYYDLVRFVADGEFDLELVSAQVVNDRSGLRVVRLPSSLAKAQQALLAVPQETREERTLAARVTAASVTKGYLELEEEGAAKLEGVVPVDGRRFLNGLRIGGYYRFEITLITHVDSPSAPPRLELLLRSAPSPDDGATPKRSARDRQPGATARKPLEWHKTMSATDALRAPSGSVRAFVPLTKSGQDVRFRDDFFADAEWTALDSGEERTTVEMEVFVDGVNLWPQSIELSYDARRVRHNRAPDTHLHWSPPMRTLLQRNNFDGGELKLRRTGSGVIELHLSKPPDGLGGPHRARRRGSRARPT